MVMNRKNKTEVINIRATDSEKVAFKKTAELARMSLSKWIRDRLRTAARHELGLD